jgi:superoxide reductase
MLAVGNFNCPLSTATCQLPTSQKTNYIFNKYNNIMPRVFKATEIEREEKEIKRDYLDRHMPHVICPDEVKRGERFAVKVKLGEEYPHPDEHDHFISVIQLWNRETLLAEARYTAGVYGNKPTHYEIDFYIVAPEVSMNLSAMSVCTKHGLWQSEDKAVKVI